MKTELYSKTSQSISPPSSGPSLLPTFPRARKTERKPKRLADYLPLPLILPGILLSLLLLSISQAQNTKEFLLFQEDFLWADNAWNSNKAAVSPIENLRFEGKAYMARRCIKLASSSQEGSMHARIPELAGGHVLLVARGARYDKSKNSLLRCLFLKDKDTLHQDTLHFSSYYKDGELEPYRQYDSMTQDGGGFASTDSLYWENTMPGIQTDLSVVIQAGANDQTFLDHCALYLFPAGNLPSISWNPDSLLIEGPVGEWSPGTIHLHSDNPPSNIRIQASGPDQSIAAHPMQFSSTELESGQAALRIEARIDSIEKRYTIACWPDTGNTPLARIPVIVRPPGLADSTPGVPSDSLSAECPMPSQLQLAGIDSNRVRLQWESNANWFLVRIGDLFSIVHQERTDRKQIEIKGLTPGNWYWWEVAALCSESDSSAYAQGGTFQVPESCRLHRQNSRSPAMATAFPNPSSGRFKLFLPHSCQVRIFNLQGRCVHTGHMAKGVHDLHLGQTGLFILQYGNHAGMKQFLKLIVL